jgi:DNA-binding NarL/FixJ family response regulator
MSKNTSTLQQKLNDENMALPDTPSSNKNQSPIRVAIFDDNSEVRDSFSAVLKFYTDIEVVGAFPNAENISSIVEKIKPDVILMDIQMPNVNGIEATAIVKSSSPGTQVIILSQYADNDNVFQALQYGATGYLLKGTDAGRVVDAIYTVMQGGSPMNVYVARKALEFFKQPGWFSKPTTDEYGLTDREKEILKSLTEGMTYQEIANSHFISIDTVRTHIRHIYEKLQARSKADAIAIALKRKLV